MLGLLVRELGEVQLLSRGAAGHHGGAAGRGWLLIGLGPGEEGSECVQPDYTGTRKEGVHIH